MKTLVNAKVAPLQFYSMSKSAKSTKKMRNQHNFEANSFLELGSCIYALKSHKKFIAKRSRTKTAPNSKKKHQQALLAVVMCQKMHFY